MKRLEYCLWQQFAGFRESLSSRIHNLPFDDDPRGLNRTHGCLGHFRPNAIAWD
jgi:hypothetical protein